jgi:hypothetical protein
MDVSRMIPVVENGKGRTAMATLPRVFLAGRGKFPAQSKKLPAEICRKFFLIY